MGLVRSGETKATKSKVENYITNSVLHDCSVYANRIIFHPGTLTIITKGKPHAH